jgi:hypothetical protein
MLYLQKTAQRLTIALLAGLSWLLLSLSAPAYAAEANGAERYIAADGSDLTAVAQCLPKSLSQGSLARAIEESGNDFLEKVFDIKANYRDYELDETEVAYLDCLESKGVTPQVER